MTEDIDILIRWLKIREEFEDGFQLTTVDQLSADIDRSSLLERMLDGDEPFKLPPPKAFGQPWYSLVESGKGSPYEVTEVDHPFDKDGGKVLLIDQVIWNIKEKISEKSWWAVCPTMPDVKWKVWYEGEKDPPNWVGKDDGKPAPRQIADWQIVREQNFIRTNTTAFTNATSSTATSIGSPVWTISGESFVWTQG